MLCVRVSREIIEDDDGHTIEQQLNLLNLLFLNFLLMEFTPLRLGKYLIIHQFGAYKENGTIDLLKYLLTIYKNILKTMNILTNKAQTYLWK